MCQEMDAQSILTCLHSLVHLVQELAILTIPQLTVELATPQAHTNRASSTNLIPGKNNGTLKKVEYVHTDADAELIQTVMAPNFIEVSAIDGSIRYLN